MSKSDLELAAFSHAFERWARVVRRSLLTRRVLTGAAFGFVVAALCSAVAWRLGHGELRAWALAAAFVGACVGIFHAARRRWSDSDVALYLDAKLESEEAISTAVDFNTSVETGDEKLARQTIVRHATELLSKPGQPAVRPRIFRSLHALAPIAGAAAVWFYLLPLPPAPAKPALPPGAERVQLTSLRGLEKLIALEKLDARDAAQQERLKSIAEQARKLREQLAKGMEQRDAQARIAKLRDDISAERLNFTDGKNRPGLEAALGKLDKSPITRDASKALGNGDLTEFDHEMQRLANQAEAESRQEAKKALEEAARAAREHGAKELARSLEDQKRLFEERESRAQALRELARALRGKLDEQALKDLEEFSERGSPEAQQRLSDALNDALQGLSDEERARVAENLKKRIEGGNGELRPMTKQELEELAKRFASPEGKEQLKEQLKELGKQEPSGDAEREQGLGDADRGGAEALRGLGAVPIPMQSEGSPGSNGNQSRGKAGGSGGPGSKKDEGSADHSGQSNPVAGNELRAKANAKMNPGAPMHGATLGRTPGRAGETARQKGIGALGSVGPAEVGGVERSEVPEEYREQVGRYFQP